MKTPPIQVTPLTGGPFGTNSLVVRRGAEALIVDPGFLGEELVEFCLKEYLDVRAILCTHGHIDHIFDLALVAEAFPAAPIGLHPADEVWAFEPHATAMFGMPPVRRPARIHRAWKEGEVYTDAGMTYRVLETPGHSPGCVCFLFEAETILVSGDTLFQGSVGRTDLPGGNPAVMSASLRKLMTLDNSLRVFPGHGDETTLGAERRDNPYVRMATRAT